MAKVAAGFIVCRRVNRGIEYLLLQTSYGAHHWTPPKGHVDPGEDELTTAKRETLEEAGLSSEQYNIISDYKETLKYNVKGSPKIVYYWLALLINPDTPIVLSDEHTNYFWGNLEETKKLSGYADMNACFDNAEELLSK